MTKNRNSIIITQVYQILPFFSSINRKFYQKRLKSPMSSAKMFTKAVLFLPAKEYIKPDKNQDYAAQKLGLVA